VSIIVVVLFQKRFSDELDLSKLSSATEDAILIQGNLKYKTIKYNHINNVLYAILEEIL